jgi:hypothetical protein
VQIFNSTEKYQNRYQEGGDTRHIPYPDVYWFEPVLYLDPVSKFRFPETTKRPGYFVEFVENVGNSWTFRFGHSLA